MTGASNGQINDASAPFATGGGSGNVTGPGSSTNNDIAVFSGTTGKIIADSGIPISSISGGPFLPLTAGPTTPLSGSLYENANIIFQTPQSFGGNNSSYVTVPNTGSRFCFGSGDFTISYWKYMASGASGNGATMLVNYTSGGYVPIAILGGGGGTDYLYISHAGSAWDIASGKTIAYPQDQWCYIVLTRVGSTFTIYVNGAAINTFSSALSVWNNGGATNPLNIGGDYSGKLDYGSYLEEVNFYNIGLSSAQVTAYYNAGKGLFGTASDTGLIAGFHFDGTLIDYKSANNGSWVNGASYSSGKYLSGGTTSVSLPISVLNDTILLPATSFSTAIKSVDGNSVEIGLGVAHPAILATAGQAGNVAGEFISANFNYGASLGFNSYAGYFTDNSRNVYLANGSEAGHFSDGSNNIASLANGTSAVTGISGTGAPFQAGYFADNTQTYNVTMGVNYAGSGLALQAVDGVRSVVLANGSYAVSAVGTVQADGGNGQFGYLGGGNSDYGVSGSSGSNGDGGGHFFDSLNNEIILANNNSNGNYVVKATGATYFDYNGSGTEVVKTTNGSYALLTQDNGFNSGSNSVSFSDGTSAMRAYVISGDKYTSINDSQGTNDSTMDAYRTFKTHVFLNANNLLDDNGFYTGVTGIASAATQLGYDAGFFSNTSGNTVRLATGNNSAINAVQGASGYAAGDFSSDRSGAPIVYLINYNTGVDAGAGNNSGGIAVSGYGGSTYGNIGGIFQHNNLNYAQAILATSGVGPDPSASTAGYFTYSSGGYGVLDAYEVAIGSDGGAIIAQDYNGLGSPVNNVQLANGTYAIQSTGDCYFVPSVGYGFVSIGPTASAYYGILDFDDGSGNYGTFGSGGNYGLDIVSGNIAAIRTGWNGFGSGNTVSLTTSSNAIESVGQCYFAGYGGTYVYLNYSGNAIDVTGNIVTSGKVAKYNNIVTAGNGVPATYGYGRLTAKTAAQASVATYTPAADGTFVVSANVLITTSTTYNFTVTVSYKDEGNTSRAATLNFSNVSGAIGTAIANAGGAIPYAGLPLQIRAKGGTAITIATTGTFTSVTYNVEGRITQLAS